MMLAGLLALTMSTAAAAPPVADARLEAFKAACVPEHREPKKRLKVIAAEGWRPAKDDADPMLAEVMKLSRKEMADSKADGIKGEVKVFSKTVDGRPLFLMITTVISKQIALTGCGVYDFGGAVIAPEPVTVWLQEAPAQTVDTAGMAGQIWNVERIEGVWDLQNSFVAKDSQASKVIGFYGASIKMTSTIAKPGEGR